MAQFELEIINGSTTQSMSALLADIGEKSVLLLLSYISYGTHWEASKVISEGGYDLLLSKKNGKKRIRIEVKTRQTILSTQENVNFVAFDLTENEWKSCDFTIGYWWDEAVFYIIPKCKLEKIRVKKNADKFIYRYRSNETFWYLSNRH